MARTAHLDSMWLLMDDAEREIVMEGYAYYAGVFQRALDVNWQPEGIAAGAHDQCDRAIVELMKRPRADEVKCSRGCSACCYLHVDITEQEAKLLHHAAHEAGLAIDGERLEKQANADTWEALPHADRACVFLAADGTCGVYEHRPSSCRKYFVLSDPEHCDTVKFPGHKVLHFVSADAEISHSAALGVFRNGSMAAMLLETQTRS